MTGGYDEEFKRLELDLVSSYIITVFGNYMEEITNLIKDNLEKYFKIKKIDELSNFENAIFKNMENIQNLKIKILKNNNKNSDIIEKILSYDGTANITIKKLENTIIGACLDSNSNDAHWIYIDENGKIHNSYNNGLQIENSNQFCQCYALLMALNPDYRNNFKNLPDSYKFGYSGLIELWEHLLGSVINFSLKNQRNNILTHNETLKIIYKVNIDEDINIVKNIIKKYYYEDKVTLTNYFLKVLKTDYAYINAPYFT